MSLNAELKKMTTLKYGSECRTKENDNSKY